MQESFRFLLHVFDARSSRLWHSYRPVWAYLQQQFNRLHETIPDSAVPQRSGWHSITDFAERTTADKFCRVLVVAVGAQR